MGFFGKSVFAANSFKYLYIVNFTNGFINIINRLACCECAASTHLKTSMN